MDSGPGEGVNLDVVELELAACRENGRVGASVLPNDVELYLGPVADAVESQGFPGHGRLPEELPIIAFCVA